MKKFTFVKVLILFFFLLANTSFSVSFAENCGYNEVLLDNSDYNLETTTWNGECKNGLANGIGNIKIHSKLKNGNYRLIGIQINGNFEGLVIKEFIDLNSNVITNYPNIFVYKDKIFTDVDEYIDFMYENTEVDFGIWDAINIRIDDYGRSSFYNLLIYFAIGITLLIYGYFGYTKNRNKDKYILKANQVNPAKPINKHVNVVSQKSGQEVLVDLKDEQVNLATQKAEQERIAKEIMAKEWAEEDKRAKQATNNRQNHNPQKEYGILNNIKSEIENLAIELLSRDEISEEEFELELQMKKNPPGYDFKREKEIIRQLEDGKIGKNIFEGHKYVREICSWNDAIKFEIPYDMLIMARARFAHTPFNGKNIVVFVDYKSHVEKYEKDLEEAKTDEEKSMINENFEKMIKALNKEYLLKLKEYRNKFSQKMENDNWKTLGPRAPVRY